MIFQIVRRGTMQMWKDLDKPIKYSIVIAIIIVVAVVAYFGVDNVMPAA